MAPPSRRRVVVDREVQTEASYPPDCVSMEKHLEECASDQFHDLCKLRDLIRSAMKEVACSVYDVVAFKDIMFKMEDKLPTEFPVTDILLLSSKLFRRTAELGRLLSCFFGVAFAEGHVDEKFHFTELRIMRKELLDVKGRFAQAEEERVRLQRMLDDVGSVAMNHSRALELLEARNAALRLHTNGLEDQMALLFSQLNEDLYHRCKDASERLTGELDNQDRMSLTKATFRQTMESLSDQLRHSRTLISDVRLLVMNCAQNSTGVSRNVDTKISKEPSIRFKLKQVENNFQQLVSRFSAVKNIVGETAVELMSAMQERRNILYLSLQHIRLYDVQNTKMRRGKAILFEMKRSVEELVKRMGITFPSGATTLVDRIGRISTQQWQVGQTLAAIRHQKSGDYSGDEAATGSTKSSIAVPQSSITSHGRDQSPKANQQTQLHRTGDAEVSNDDRFTASTSDFNMADDKGNVNEPFQTIYTPIDLAKQLDTSMENLSNTLNFENEINAFLKALTLSLSTTPRDTGGTFENFMDGEGAVERALIPTGSASKMQHLTDLAMRRPLQDREGLNISNPSFSGRIELPPSAGGTQVSPSSSEQRWRMQKLQEQLDNVRPEFAAKVSLLRQVYESRIWDLEMKESSIHRRLEALETERGNEEKETKAHQGRGDHDILSMPLIEKDISKKKVEGKDIVLQSRKEWKKTKPTLKVNKTTRVATLNEIAKMSRGVDPTEDSRPSTKEKRNTTSSRGSSTEK